jgi:hypothetical protein
MDSHLPLDVLEDRNISRAEAETRLPFARAATCKQENSGLGYKPSEASAQFSATK